MASSPLPLHALANRIQAALEWHRAGQFSRAEAEYSEILRIAPSHAEALRLFGICKLQQGDLVGALAIFDRAVSLQPAVPGFQLMRGDTLLSLGRAADAVGAYDREIALRPDSFEAHNNRGNALRTLADPASALQAFDRAQKLSPRHPAPHNNRASALLELRRPREALNACREALALQPDYADAWYNSGSALMDMGQLDDAVRQFAQALVIEPQYFKALFNLGISLELLSKYAEADVHFSRLLQMQPEYPQALGHLIAARTHRCAWDGLESLRSALRRGVEKGKPVCDPFTLLTVCDDPRLQLRCAKQYIAEELLAPQAPPPRRAQRERSVGERVRIAYISADFHEHATARLLIDVLERHDRSRFELTGVSFGPDDGSAMRARLAKAFDNFVDVRETSDVAVAEMLRAAQIAIAVDLKGFTANSRPGIFARHAAPVQASFLGYPGTLGTPFIDYLIADSIVVPDEHRAAFSESIVYLPHCYQPNDSTRSLPGMPLTRVEAGLPNDAFVFCCFNNSYKITPELFDVWMRMLRRTPGSALWLLQDNDDVVRNLRVEAQRRGVEAERLVFAPRVAPSEHLARHRLADLFLDTLPVNAHTTASDALSAGLPLLTCVGAGFAGRVAASALHAIGLPELATSNLDEYEALGVKLATDEARLRGLASALERNRNTHPLFDANLFRRHLEQAYRAMWNRHCSGQPPCDLRVEPQPRTANDDGGRPAATSASIRS